MTTIAQAIANRNTTRVNIPVIGDSVTEGQGASTFNNRWIAKANSDIRTLFPTTANGSNGGIGFIPIAGTGEVSFTWPVTGGNTNVHPEGPVRGGATMTGGGNTTYTWTAPAGTTSVRIMYYANGTGDQFTYQVASGSIITVTDSSNTGDGALTSSIAISGGQVLTISFASGTVYMEGLVHYAGDENSGITFHGCGHYGWLSGTTSETDAWNQTGFGSSFPWQPSIAALNPAALGFMLGINDSHIDADGPTFQSHMNTLITGLQAFSGLSGLPLLIIIPYQANETFIDAGGWPAYVTALKNVAAAYPGTTVVDLSSLMLPVASNPGYYADQYHPNDAGHTLIGGYVANGLVPASGLLMAGIV